MKNFKSKISLDLHVEKKHYAQPKEAFFNQSDFIEISKEIEDKLITEDLYCIEFIDSHQSKIPERLQSFIINLLSHKFLGGKKKGDHDSF